MAISFANVLAKNRCKSRDSYKTVKINLYSRGLLKSQEGLTHTTKPSPFQLKHSLNHNTSLPNIKTSQKSDHFLPNDSKVNCKIAHELLIKKTETLMAYRVRLRTLLDTEYKPDRTISQNSRVAESTRTVNFKIALPHKGKKIIPKKKISLVRKIKKKVLKTANDPYYFANIVTSSNFTPFYKLLNIYADTLGNFSYCNKACKENLRSEIVIPFVENKSLPCKCGEKNGKRKGNGGSWPFLTMVYHDLRRVICIGKLLIVNLESVLLENSRVFRSWILEFFQEFCQIFNVVIVTCRQGEHVASEVLEIFALENLSISGIYQVVNSEANQGLLDYSQIFIKFHCMNPRKSCLIITHHRLYDPSEVTAEEMIGKKIGTRVKFNTELVAFPKADWKIQPIQFVLSSPSNAESGLENLIKFSKYIKDLFNRRFYLRNSFDFETVLREAGFPFTFSELPYMQFLMQSNGNFQVITNRYCLHHNQVEKVLEDEVIHNIFII